VTEPFELCTVAHLVRPLGVVAHDLQQLRDAVAVASPSALFQHTVQHRLRHQVGDEPPRDDLSAWVAGVVQDLETAERLGFAIAEHSASPDGVREAILGVLDALPERARHNRDAPEGGDFIFLEVDSVVLPTGHHVRDAAAVLEALPQTDVGVWFYHLLEEPWFGDLEHNLVNWVAHQDEKLAQAFRAEVATGLPIETIRRRLMTRMRRRMLPRRVLEAAGHPPDVRRETSREIVSRLIRRRRGGDNPGEAKP
jgi:hypothetical protein